MFCLSGNIMELDSGEVWGILELWLKTMIAEEIEKNKINLDHAVRILGISSTEPDIPGYLVQENFDLAFK